MADIKAEGRAGSAACSLSFLHTAQSNADLFEDLLRDSAVTRRHVVRDDLRRRALVEEGLTPAIQAETEQALRDMALASDVVVLTCSTLGPAADALAGLPVLRIDRALARAAVRDGSRVIVLCTARTTLEPTRALFAEEAAATGAQVEVRLLAGNAWQAFLAGERAAYHSAIAVAADEAAGECDVVALAQCSMAPAVSRCRRATPLTSLHLGLQAALAMTQRD